jgi:hypothetical protein
MDCHFRVLVLWAPVKEMALLSCSAGAIGVVGKA